ncbi:hypothetical protein [Desulfobacula phenolica]|uniref:Uncharacterized protein n=1 Tax=Desulfobacula phenolica TaxID=90732 RepID=A0A1H2EH41_9BACT|nr:hypothetical protein [Desulfobacula phenolica]SDT94329.1 hypothetical protein SAMN04487931_103106 [Desulfobacula phenolica]
MGRKFRKKSKLTTTILLIFLFCFFICPPLLAEPVTAGFCFDYLTAKLLGNKELMSKDTEFSSIHDSYFQTEEMGFEPGDDELEHEGYLRRKKVEKIMLQTIEDLFRQTRTGKKINRLETKISNFSKIEYIKYADEKSYLRHRSNMKNDQKKIFGLRFDAHLFNNANLDPSDCELEVSSFYYDTRASAAFKPINNEFTVQFTKSMSQYTNSKTILEFAVSGSETQCMIKFGFDF